MCQDNIMHHYRGKSLEVLNYYRELMRHKSFESSTHNMPNCLFDCKKHNRRHSHKLNHKKYLVYLLRAKFILYLKLTQ